MKKTENRKAHIFKDEYDNLKANIITNIWLCVFSQNDHYLDLTDHRESIPINSWEDDSITETIDELVIRDGDVIAISNCMEYNIEEAETNLKVLDVPMLIDILRVTEDLIQPK